MNSEAGLAKLFFTTGEACVLAGISPHTLRYWEKKMNLSFHRSPRGKRMLRHEDVARLKKVASLLREGYSLKAVPARIRDSVQLELPLRQTPGHIRILKRIREGLEELAEKLAEGGGK